MLFAKLDEEIDSEIGRRVDIAHSTLQLLEGYLVEHAHVKHTAFVLATALLVHVETAASGVACTGDSTGKEAAAAQLRQEKALPIVAPRL